MGESGTSATTAQRRNLPEECSGPASVTTRSDRVPAGPTPTCITPHCGRSSRVTPADHQPVAPSRSPRTAPAIECDDHDGDSLMDCIVGGNTGSGGDGVGRLHYYRGAQPTSAQDGTSRPAWQRLSTNLVGDLSPYPSPACDVWLGSHIDCLVGVEDGRVLHFEGSGIESATHLPQLALTTGDYFPPVVAGV